MEKEVLLSNIENVFRKKVQHNPKVNNAYLLVHSDKMDIHLRLAEGKTGKLAAHPDQPNYMASVGKLFTSTLVGILHENEELSFEDSIANYLDAELLEGLHVYKKKNYTNDIKIKHLLNQTSGLADNFWPLLTKINEDPNLTIKPHEAIEWTKIHAKPHFSPGQGFKYTDTNYHLLGLIIERIVGMPFHEALKFYFFEPLDMKHSFMLHFSKPLEKSPHPVADFTFGGRNLNESKAFAGLDYAGGGVVATTMDLLKFMKALAGGRLVTKETLELMKSDSSGFATGIDYGYGIWQFKSIPLLMPAKFSSWGVAGATGAFMFYHPITDSFLIGNFNECSWQRKAIRFMLLSVVKQLLKL